MNNIQAHAQKAVPGFWKRLLLVAEETGESYAERLEKRVGRLEAEVERLSAIQKKPAKA
ncbi:MAG: hypothetical protein ACRED3_18910 [Bradyrhizobium sp.]